MKKKLIIIFLLSLVSIENQSCKNSFFSSIKKFFNKNKKFLNFFSIIASSYLLYEIIIANKNHSIIEKIFPYFSKKNLITYAKKNTEILNENNLINKIYNEQEIINDKKDINNTEYNYILNEILEKPFKDNDLESFENSRSFVKEKIFIGIAITAIFKGFYNKYFKFENKPENNYLKKDETKIVKVYENKPSSSKKQKIFFAHCVNNKINVKNLEKIEKISSKKSEEKEFKIKEEVSKIDNPIKNIFPVNIKNPIISKKFSRCLFRLFSKRNI